MEEPEGNNSIVFEFGFATVGIISLALGVSSFAFNEEGTNFRGIMLMTIGVLGTAIGIFRVIRRIKNKRY